ncbi:ROK family protein [Enterococcus sp. LJL90]
MYVGIDIGGTSIKYGLVNVAGQVSQSGKIKTDHSLEGLLNDLTAIITEFQKEEQVEGVGISAPGIIQSDGFMTTGGAIRELYGVNLKELIEKRVQLPIFVENDANAAAIAEQWVGNAQGKMNYLCVVIGTGMGGGIIINDQIYRGAHGMAGEFGFMVTKDVVDANDVEAASLNQTASVIGGICNQYNKLQPDAEPIFSSEKIMELAEAKDANAVKVMANFYHNLGVGLLNLISCFDPEVVLIGGGISENQQFMENLRSSLTDLETNHQSIKFLMDKTFAEVLPAKLKNNAGLIGAVYQVHKVVQGK